MEGSLKKLLSEADRVIIDATSSLQHVSNHNETHIRVIAKSIRGESTQIEIIEKDMDINKAIDQMSAGLLNSKKWAEAQKIKAS